MNSKSRRSNRSQERILDDIIETKRSSLKKIGVNLKADDKNKVIEAEDSDDSQNATRIRASLQQEKVEALSKRLHDERQ